MNVYLSTTDLRERGWTINLIRKHLGKPDTHDFNPSKSVGRKQQLYFASRVMRVEATSDYQQARDCKDALIERMSQHLIQNHQQLETIV